jgi:hypothetical protein
MDTTNVVLNVKDADERGGVNDSNRYGNAKEL